MCSSCESNLAMFAKFKTVCTQSDEKARHGSLECIDIKVEEVLLEDLDWQNISNFPNDDENNKIILKNYNREKSPNHDKFSIQEKEELTVMHLFIPV